MDALSNPISFAIRIPEQFLFFSSSIGRPSPKNFRLQWEFQCENDQKDKMAKNHFSGVQNGSESV